MRRLFVMFPGFDKRWKEAELSDDDLSLLQSEISGNPTVGKVIRNSEGLRKVRFARPGSGKSGGVRVCYLDIPEIEVTYLITLFKKSDKENLTPSEVNQIAKFILGIKKDTISHYKRGTRK